MLHLAGPGTDFRKWNNTGVWKNVAVAAGPVHVSKDWKPVVEGSSWTVCQQAGVSIAIHSRADLGIVCLSRLEAPKALLASVEETNADEGRLIHSFQTPAGDLIEYELTAPKNRWVITQINNQPVDRKFDRWSRIEEL